MKLPLKINLASQEDRNLFYLAIEVIFTAVLASAQSFFQLFALRLGATNTEIGLLTSLPALSAILLSIPIGRLLQNQPNPRRWVFGGLIANRLMLAALVVVPFVQPVGISQGTLVIAILIAAGIPLLMFNNGIYPIIMKLLPGERWAGLFSLRSMISLITTAGGVYLLSLWLHASPFPANYQVMILGAVIVSLISLVFWLKARPSRVETQNIASGVETQNLASLRDTSSPPAQTHPQKDGAGDFASLQGTSSPAVETHPKKDGAGNLASLQGAPSPTPKTSFRQQFKILESLNLRTDFGRVILNQILQYAGIWMVTPLYILYLVKSLGAAESWLGMNATIVSISALVGSLLARYLIGRWGEPLVLKRFSQVVSIYPILLGLSSSLTPALFTGAINSLLSPAYSLSHNNNLLGSFPPGKEHEGIAVYNTVTSIGSFILPLAGVILANQFGIQPVLIGCGLLSLAGSLSFWVWPVKGEWKLRRS